ncbi:MAG: hypothetical protein DRJ05_06070 [Bacteroidetes bacterium]|nr:MAG: hypothetical protein DRJ05_06070 [Bacteroidota bacterium]
MKINKENYEAYFLDYYEKSLNTQQVAELMVFLEENPALKGGFEDFDLEITLDFDNDLRFNEKESLKKTGLISFGGIDEINYEQTMLAELDGELSEKGSIDLKGFLSVNPKLKLEYNLLKSTFLVPDEKVVFDNKEELKKGGVFAIYSTQIYYALSIAATIIILLGFYFGISKKEQSNREFTNLEKMETIHPSFSEKEIIETRNITANHDQKTILENPEIQKPENNHIQPQSERIGTRKKEKLFASIPFTDNIKISTNKNNETPLISSRSSFDGVSTNSFKNPVPEKDKPFVARFIKGLASKLVPNRDNGNKSFIEYTVEGFNMMADKDMEVIRQKDENGNVIAYNVVGDNMQFTRRKRNVGKE